ncbi:MAG: DUF4440 domain-containing protein [Verrucomicrobia bacterium]|nr:DUF4440 domain-containing protein [Verrucomicrobiota bacterium]
MKNPLLPLLASFALGFSLATAQPPPTGPLPPPLPSVELPPDLARVLRDYEKAWTAKDAAALAKLFVADGFALPNGLPAVRGTAALEKFYTTSGGSPLALRALAFGTSGDLGYILGGYADGPGQPDIGKFTLVLKRGSDGRWLILSDMDNPNPRRAPAAVPGASPKPTQKPA